MGKAVSAVVSQPSEASQIYGQIFIYSSPQGEVKKFDQVEIELVTFLTLTNTAEHDYNIKTARRAFSHEHDRCLAYPTLLYQC